MRKTALVLFCLVLLLQFCNIVAGLFLINDYVEATHDPGIIAVSAVLNMAGAVVHGFAFYTNAAISVRSGRWIVASVMIFMSFVGLLSSIVTAGSGGFVTNLDVLGAVSTAVIVISVLFWLRSEKRPVTPTT